MTLIGSQIQVFGEDDKGYWEPGQQVPKTPKTFKIIYGSLYVHLEGYDAKSGLIYGSDNFLREFNALLQKHGLALEATYSESGAQGDDYVHLDLSARLPRRRIGFRSGGQIHLTKPTEDDNDQSN